MRYAGRKPQLTVSPIDCGTVASDSFANGAAANSFELKTGLAFFHDIAFSHVGRL